MKKLIISFRLVFSQVTLTAQKTENYIQYINPFFGAQKMGHTYSGATAPLGTCAEDPY
jgi:hypothetical protein